MTTLIFAYGLAWSAVASYVGWLAYQHRRLSRRSECLRELTENNDAVDSVRRAA